jgi:ATPase subunit of ABC transporter with duplicated ATPase domains
VCITGKNGAGKTTLLKIIADELLSRDDIKCGYMPQSYEELLELDKTPVEFLVKSGLRADTTRAMTFLGSVKYTPDEMAHTVAALSGGQKAKLMFLKMILDGCNVLVLDEPTRNFSPMSNPVIREILREFGGAIISVSHDRRYISEVCDTVYELTPEGLIKKDD